MSGGQPSLPAIGSHNPFPNPNGAPAGPAELLLRRGPAPIAKSNDAGREN